MIAMQQQIDELNEKINSMQEIVGSCQINVYNRLELHDSKFDVIEDMLNRQSQHGKENNAKLVHMMTSLQEWADKHGEEEMARIEENRKLLSKLVDKLDKVDKQTDANSSYIRSAQYNEELESRVAKKIEEAEAPKKEMIHKIKMVAITTITGIVVTGGATLIWFLIDLYSKFNGAE